MSTMAITMEQLELLPPMKRRKIESLMGVHPEAAERELELMLGEAMPREPKPQVLLDENVVFLNFPRDPSFPMLVIDKLKEKGIDATYVGDTRKFEALDRKEWTRAVEFQDYSKAMDICQKEIQSGFFRGKKLKTPAQQNKAYKSCVHERYKRLPKGGLITGVHQIPPRETEDAQIGKWADDYGILIVSFDADAGLEGKELGDRILLSQESMECVESPPVARGERLCSSRDDEAERLTSSIIRRMRKVKDLLSGDY